MDFWNDLRKESQQDNIPVELIDALYELFGKLSPREFIAKIDSLSTDEKDPLIQTILSRQMDIRQRVFDKLSQIMSKKQQLRQK